MLIVALGRRQKTQIAQHIWWGKDRNER